MWISKTEYKVSEMDRHLLKDEENVMNLEAFLQEFSERPDQLRAAELDETPFNPEIKFLLSSPCSGSNQNTGTDVLSQDSAGGTLIFGQGGAVRTLASHCVTQQPSCAGSSDSSVQSGHLNMPSWERPVPVSGGNGISSQNGADLDAANQDGTHGVCGSSRDRNPSVEGDTLTDAPRQSKTRCVYGSNDSYGAEISLAFAAPSRSEFDLTMLQPKYLSADCSVLELADAGSGPRNGATLNAPKEGGNDDDPVLIDSCVKRISGSSPAPSRNELSATERKVLPVDISVLELSCTQTSSRNGAAVDVPQYSGHSGLNETFREGTCRSFLSPSEVEYTVPASNLESSVLELADPGTCSLADATLVAPKRAHCGIPDTGDSVGLGISHFLAVTSRNEYKMTIPEPISSVPQPGAPKIGPPKCVALFAPKRDGSPVAPDDTGDLISQFFAGPSRNEYNLNMVDTKSPPESGLQESAAVEAAKQDGPPTVRGSNSSLQEGISLALAAPSRNEYETAIPEQESTSAADSCIPITSNAPEQDIVLPESYESFKEGMKVCLICGVDCVHNYEYIECSIS